MKRIFKHSIINGIARALRDSTALTAGFVQNHTSGVLGQARRKEPDLWRDLPSFRKEGESGIEPPYEFNCTLVRTEINNFARIYQNNPTSEFMATLDEFYTEVAHIVSRYGGYVYEFTGAEAIYYFKDDEVASSMGIALAAVEDANAVAARKSARLLKERNYPLVLKSALTHDRLRYGRLVNSLCLAGPAFVETARILSAVSESGGNVIVFDGRHRPLVGDVVRVEPYAELALKGYPGKREICMSGGRKRLREWLNLNSKESLNQLEYYRSDESLAEIIYWLQQPKIMDSFKTVIEVIARIRQVPATHSSGEPLAALIEWIDSLLADEEGSSREKRHILAAAVRLIENLACDLRADIDFSALKARLNDLLERLSRHGDRRVTANALETSAAIDLLPSSRISMLTGHVDNRVAANALVWSGKREITAFVIRELSRMIHSNHPARAASGLFALGEIASHHRSRDPEHYRAQIEIQEMVAELADWAKDENDSIRRQALSAARKIGDPALDKALQAIISAADGRPTRLSG